jgi:hypothetical protein
MDERLGFLFWRADVPGRLITRYLGPMAGLVLLVMLGAMATLVWSLWRSGKRLSAAVLDLQASEAQAQHLAFHDVLTGLANRALFHDRLDQALARARRGKRCAVLALDLDRFKQVNDTLGHAAGDALIRDFAQRLSKRCAPPTRWRGWGRRVLPAGLRHRGRCRHPHPVRAHSRHRRRALHADGQPDLRGRQHRRGLHARRRDGSRRADAQGRHRALSGQAWRARALPDLRPLDG